jgi:UDPglucose 6-dehydrogenase
LNICVIGTGYVGLVAGTCLAESGNDVICMDADEAKIAKLNKGEVPIYERGLEDLLERNLKEGRLRFTTRLEEAVPAAQIVFIAVGTPAAAGGEADLQNVFAVAKAVARLLHNYTVIVIKSTVPVGTTEKIGQLIAAETKVPFDMVMNPEFMKEGAAVDDFMRPDRVVIGAQTERAARTMKELYEPFVRTEKPILAMDIKSAEMTKYAANAMLATKISFINEIAYLCDRFGADVNDVRRGIGFDSRIGFQFLFPGVGYGGSCFPKDVAALISSAREVGYQPRILEAVQEVNRAQREWMVERIQRHFPGGFEDPIAFWGLSFKPQTDDVREAPAMDIIRRLVEAGAVIRAYDPVAAPNAAAVFGDRVIFCDTAYEALGGAAALVIVTEWNEFRRPNFERMQKLMKKPVIFDGRNLYDLNTMKDLGFVYYSIGRKTVGGKE